MAITINGSANTVAGLSAGGLPDNTVDGGNLAMGSDAAGDILYYNGTDYIRLAKGTDGQVLKLASGVPTWAADTAGGITVADQWHLDDDEDVSSGEYIDNGWVRCADDVTGWGGIGSAMTESSGVFTFPSTGVYRITFYAQGFSASTEMDWVYARINGTTNNFTSTNTLVEGYSNILSDTASGNVYAQVTCDTLFDVTDTANRKVKVWAQASTGTWTLHSSSGASRAHIMFIRLGDT